MFECAQAHPEYNAPSGNKRVKLRVTDHKDTESLRSKGKKQHRDIIFANKLEADMSWVQNKRKALACQSGHRTESVKQTVEARQCKTA